MSFLKKHVPLQYNQEACFPETDLASQVGCFVRLSLKKCHVLTSLYVTQIFSTMVSGVALYFQTVTLRRKCRDCSKSKGNGKI